VRIPTIKRIHFKGQECDHLILQILRSNCSDVTLLKAEGEWQRKIKPSLNKIIIDEDGRSPPTEYTIKRTRETNTGRKHTNEWKKEARKRMKGNQYALGRTWTLSDETKARMSKPKSPEHRAKLAAICRKNAKSQRGANK
jgi:hypothetical protein